MVSTWNVVRLEPLLLLFLLSLSAWARHNLTSTSSLECSLRQFKCDNGRCIQQMWVCDLEDDCGDNSDEKPDHCAVKDSCEVSEFRCNNGRCIPKKWHCDLEPDCPDGSDENDFCAKTECQVDHFECSPGICIPISWKCDGQPDCNNGEDEKHCTETCAPDFFTCHNGNCIPQANVCDLDDDCGDGSDEKNCTKKVCPKSDFQCHDSSCIVAKWRCDGDYDCPDMSDEKGCPREIAPTSVCLDKEFQCPDLFTCIHLSWVCDGESDCPDGADESSLLCANVTCRSDQFRCNNNYCIAEHLRCNGQEDCSDGSDEEDCNESLCEQGEFYCGEDLCIPISKVCNGKYDCPNGQDEPHGKCGVNECSVDNGKCDHKCVDMLIGYQCECHKGYRLVGNVTCVDIDECVELGSCSQTCINQKGTFKCECQHGYETDPHDSTSCKATEGKPQLLFSRRHSIQQLNLQHHNSSTVISDTKAATALDFELRNEMIFWSDSLEKKIYKASIRGGDGRVEVIKEGIVLCDGLAVDWMYGHIYWTDTGKNTIELSNYDGGMRKTLVKDSLDEPRSIALSPEEGWLFWSDWGKQGRIERAGLDGSFRKVIVSQDVKWPNGITLDLISKRLYWVDAKLNSISSCNFDGSSRHLVVRSPDVLHHPFSISVFEDYVYWSDWDTQTIFKANKFRGSNVTAVTENRMLQNPMVVQVYHPYRQPLGINHCGKDNGKCSHLCLPRPRINSLSSKIACACPDGLHLSVDGVSCLDEEMYKKISRNEYRVPNRTIPVEIVFDDILPPVPNQELNLLSIIIISGVAMFLLTLSLVTLILCRYYLNSNFTIHFEHPFYQKAAEDDLSTRSQSTTEDMMRQEDVKEEACVPLTSPGSYDIV